MQFLCAAPPWYGVLSYGGVDSPRRGPNSIGQDNSSEVFYTTSGSTALSALSGPASCSETCESKPLGGCKIVVGMVGHLRRPVVSAC